MNTTLTDSLVALRDQFAMHALTGLLAAMRNTANKSEEDMAKDFAEVSYKIADAMLTARGR